jgi:DNA segregation ATPase FtsK/SpoIIIE and related proteins
MAKRSTKQKKKTSKQNDNKAQFGFLKTEIILLAVLAFSILLFISNFGFGGAIGKGISSLFFGIFGFMSYAFPVILFIGVAFGMSNKENLIAIIKLIATSLFYICVCAFLEIMIVGYQVQKSFLSYYQYGVEHKNGGGVLGGMIIRIFSPAFGAVGTYVILSIISITCLVIISEKSFLNGLRKSSAKVIDTAKKDVMRRRKKAEIKKAERVEQQGDLRKDNIIKGVALDTILVKGPDILRGSETEKEKEVPRKKERNSEKDVKIEKEEDVIVKAEAAEPVEETTSALIPKQPSIHRGDNSKNSYQTPEMTEIFAEGSEQKGDMKNIEKIDEAVEVEQIRPKETNERIEAVTSKGLDEKISIAEPRREYVFPPLSLLKKGKKNTGGASDKVLRDTAAKLQKTLQDFGVKVSITNISCGPSVTRYELQPEQGVKVSKIVNLADDIKLNLAAADIRIEAPIPGKAAVGIEIPNKENSPVMFRELIESEAFKKSESNLAFAAGKNIGGQVVVTDIAKMPHLLIAGATGSGKSVCINTIIMSILYKASPEDVKLIMIDPKVVELNVYNGIPHLFIPVVTDPKKAANALNWCVTEMMERYNKFAEYNVRDIKGYNKKINSIKNIEDEEKPKKLPHILIIVDELADLMMVAPGEVEDAICRLAQLARAAGIHLVIATQRPSVNVITGLIKANMPSRIAFSVSSGIDSRTILDMHGAEKLLGKGDMLFYPQGYQKPERVQGAFVSDKEVFDVVAFLKEKNDMIEYNSEIQEKLNSVTNAAGSNASDIAENNQNGRDDYFIEAGKFIIEKEKASIGMLQRTFKIGFNRAARIMDQLMDAGVVGEEEGTKPRKVLISMEEFEAYIDEYV